MLVLKTELKINPFFKFSIVTMQTDNSRLEDIKKTFPSYRYYIEATCAAASVENRITSNIVSSLPKPCCDNAGWFSAVGVYLLNPVESQMAYLWSF